MSDEWPTWGDHIDQSSELILPGGEPVKITATPYIWRPASTLPRQSFLYGYELQRGHLSAIIAPGAAGKSTYLMARALCMASGLEKFRQRVWNGPHRVWLWNLEDKRLHLERMLQAFAIHHGLKEEDLADRLFLDSAVKNGVAGDEYSPQALKLAVEVRGVGCVIQEPVVQALIEALRSRKIDHLDVDPFVSSHGVSENDNGAIDAVSKKWAYVAAEANCSISLSHHIKKIEGREATATDARGATSLINACRSALVINTMDAEQANECGVPVRDRKDYFSMVDGKSNRARAATKLDWFRKVGVGLGNADVGEPGPEDNVATIEAYRVPDNFGGLTTNQLRYVQDQVTRFPDDCREHASSPAWVGRLIADALSLSIDLPSDKARVQLFLRKWLENGLLATEVRKVRGEDKKFVVVGEPVADDRG